MQSRFKPHIAVVFISGALALLGCDQKQFSSSGSGSAGADASKASGASPKGGATNPGNGKGGVPNAGSGPGAGSKPCGPNGITQVKLLTPSVTSKDPANHLDYEVSAVDCAGNPLTELQGAIDFDIGATTDVGEDGLPYAVTESAADHQGTLTVVQGQDLFGNAGPNFRFFRSSEPIKLNPKTKSVKIRIDLLGAEIQSYTEEDIKNGTLATFLRFGTAATVEQSVPLVAK